MNDLLAALWPTLLAIGVTPILLVGALAYLFRERLKQSMARALASHTEAIRLDAQREIEAYKVSLIADVERAKAVADVAKNIAIKHALREYEALTELVLQLNSAPTSIASMAQVVPTWGQSDKDRLDQYREAVEIWKALEAAKIGAFSFLTNAQRMELLQLLQWTRTIAFEHIRPGCAALPASAAEPWWRRVNALEDQLETRIEELKRLTP